MYTSARERFEQRLREKRKQQAQCIAIFHLQSADPRTIQAFCTWLRSVPWGRGDIRPIRGGLLFLLRIPKELVHEAEQDIEAQQKDIGLFLLRVLIPPAYMHQESTRIIFCGCN